MDRNPQAPDIAIRCRILENCVSGESCYFEIEFQLTATGYQSNVEGLPPSEELMNGTCLNHCNLQNFVSSLSQVKNLSLNFCHKEVLGNF